MLRGAWRSVSGTVIYVEPLYMSKSETRLASGCLLLLCIPFLPIIAGILLGLILSSVMLSLAGFGRHGQPGFLSHLASQVTGYFLVGKLFGPKEQVPVRDFRVRDAKGTEHLVRIRGELVSGTVTVGDTVEVAGYNNGGTLMLQSGINTRLGAQIRVRRS